MNISKKQKSKSVATEKFAFPQLNQSFVIIRKSKKRFEIVRLDK